MKKFILVAWDTYYPYGGLDNIQSTHDTLEAAKAAMATLQPWDKVQIIDRDTLKVLHES